MSTRWPSLIAWLFLAILLLLFIGYSEFSWKLTKIIPYGIASLFLFFQFLTISRMKSVFFRRINQVLLLAQLFLLFFFIFNMLEIKSIWKFNMILLLAATHVYLLDLNNRYIQNRIYSKWLLLLSLTVSLISFVLIQFFEAAIRIGFTSTFISGIVVLSNIFLFNPKKEKN